MNIGIYGNSICEWNRVQDFSFIKKLEDFYSANIIHTGTTMCSEERILFDLKKTKNLDLAIIFHAKARWIYIPSWHRDIESLDRYTIIKKIHSFPGYSEGYTFDNNEGESSILATRRWYQDCIGETKFKDSKLSPEELLEALLLNKKYMFSFELQCNRFCGALVQIDQYLNFKQIPVVHCLSEKEFHPEWFNFSSGVVNHNITEIRKIPEYKSGFDLSCNGVNAAGNDLIFNQLVPLIDAARSKVVIR